MSKISLKHSGGNVVSLNSPTNAPGAADVAFKLPNADGSDGQALVTDGSGNLSFTSISGAGKATNLMINGAMRVAQRGTYYPNVDNNETTIDRFSLIHPYGDYFDVTQSTDSPDGFSKSYKLDINTVDSSIGSGQYVAIRQRIEAQNLQQLAFGTSAAKPITLSFYVRSNKTGTFAINIQQTDNSSKQVSAPYTISSANTW